MVLNSLLPHSLWEHFEKITQIPRPSGKEGKMVEHIARIAEENGLSFKTDAFRNILVSKPATKGRESSPKILLQAHTDMVCEKNQEVDFDFSTQPIQTEIEGDWVKAKGTTLGADDGIGVAMMLNILTSKDLEHGPIDCLFTSDEEVGMTGAIHLDSEMLRAKKMINLDSEEEGAITIGCSGGTDIYINIPLELESVGEGNYCFSLSVSGGMGGHSGGDIHLGRSNANKLIVNFLHLLEEEMRVRLVDFAGGSARNAIPRYSSIKAIIPFEQKEKVRTLLNIYTSEVEKKFAEIDPKITFSLESEDIPSQCITEELSKKIINTLYECPNGMIKPYGEEGKMMQTSTNWGVIKMEEGNCFISIMSRSFITEELKELVSRIVSCFNTISSANIQVKESYMPWKPNKDSSLLQTAQSLYKRKYEEEPKVSITPGGLECGVFISKNKDMEIISIGPTMRDIHSPKEMLSISSTQRVWEYLVELLKAIQ